MIGSKKYTWLPGSGERLEKPKIWKPENATEGANKGQTLKRKRGTEAPNKQQMTNGLPTPPTSSPDAIDLTVDTPQQSPPRPKLKRPAKSEDHETRPRKSKKTAVEPEELGEDDLLNCLFQELAGEAPEQETEKTPVEPEKLGEDGLPNCLSKEVAGEIKEQKTEKPPIEPERVDKDDLPDELFGPEDDTPEQQPDVYGSEYVTRYIEEWGQNVDEGRLDFTPCDFSNDPDALAALERFNGTGSQAQPICID